MSSTRSGYRSQAVSVVAGDGLRLEGHLFWPSTDTFDTCLIFNHGLASSPEATPFLPRLVQSLVASNVAVLAGRTRGSEVMTVMRHQNGSPAWQGSAYEHVSESHLDIQAWIDYAYEIEGFERVIEMGHSMGAVKLMDYLSRGNGSSFDGLILLAPVDPIAFFRKDNGAAILCEAERKFRNSDRTLLVNSKPFPMSAETFLEWDNFDICPLRLGRAPHGLNKFHGDLLVLMGEDDRKIGTDPVRAASALMQAAPLAHTKFADIIKGGHGFRGPEMNCMVRDVRSWVQRLNLGLLKPLSPRQAAHAVVGSIAS